MKAVHDTPAPRAAIRQAVRDLKADASIEVTPGRVTDGPGLAALLPAGTSVYLPFLPGARFRDTVRACRRLLADGFVPVPHVAPRAAKSRNQMREWLAGLEDAGVRQLMLIAGDRKRAAGPFSSTLDLLDSGLLIDHGLRRLGVAGHPEGHPVLTEAGLDDALAMKREYAAETGSELWIVTQFVFSSAPTLDWLRRLHDEEGCPPVYVGIPGPAKLRTLIAYAAHCGVSASARVLKKRPGAARLLTCWTPDGLLQDFAYHRATDALFAGIHLYPFGGIARCRQWLEALESDRSGDELSDAAGAPPA